MKKLFIAVAVALCALLASSCSTMSNITVANSGVIDQANFQIVRPVSTEVVATYVLGIGGNKAQKLVEDAVSTLAKDLGPNQALAYVNVVESTKIPFIPVFFTKTFKVNAFVVQYK